MARDIILKDYQASALLTFRRYLERTVEVGARLAYMDLTSQPYDEPQGLEGLPYVCLRVPTGGGKTCDEPLCVKCTHEPVEGKNLCRTHAAQWSARNLKEAT